MKSLFFASAGMMWILSATCTMASQEGHMKGMHMPTKNSDRAPAVRQPLEPADGASVKIISPKANQVIKGDKLPLQVKLAKGKRGEHIHAYVDGQLRACLKVKRER